VVLDRHLRACDLLEFFPVRVYSSETVHRKPDGRIYGRALERLGVEAGEAEKRAMLRIWSQRDRGASARPMNIGTTLP
jgi:hypothetical protein